MINTYTVMVPGCYGVKLGRKTALRECVMKAPGLHYEFMKTIPDIMSITTDEHSCRMEYFIKKKGLRILSEKPVARAIDDHYIVDVYYTVTW